MYFLYTWRWPIRALCGFLVLAAVPSVARSAGWRRRLALPAMALAGAVVYITNAVMSADRIFIADPHRHAPGDVECR